MAFQFLMVRLKENNIVDKANLIIFQFLMVRLKAGKKRHGI